ncbi:hypothetical protein IV203_007609 [Nitzschia inconspicua]|uniref:Uncharacterized protein n=1 Tax=Nitzschia inconspicua TaxID=303405 RepID=A0A9K3KFU6_9STRA|nr:hypothetical protein IV203_007609 [Nitzschia inconspicua]
MRSAFSRPSTSNRSRSRSKGKKTTKKKKQQQQPSLPMQVLPSVPETQEQQSDLVAKLREHLAFVRESHQESLKEIQAFQALTCADRLELEALRKLVKQQNQQQQQHRQHVPQPTVVPVLQYESDDEDQDKDKEDKQHQKSSTAATQQEISDDQSNTLLPSSNVNIEQWHQELQTLAKDKADCELRLLQQCNQLRDVKYLLTQIQLEKEDLQKQLALAIVNHPSPTTLNNSNVPEEQQQNQGEVPVVSATRTSSSSSFSKRQITVSATDATANDATLQELQDEVHQWEALYFETAETGSRSIQALETRVEQLLRDNERLEKERNQAYKILLQQKKQQQQQSAENDGSVSTASMEHDPLEEKKQENDNSNCGQGPILENVLTPSHQSESHDANEVLWLERMQYLEPVTSEEDETKQELLQQRAQREQTEEEKEVTELEESQHSKVIQEQQPRQEKIPPTPDKSASIVSAANPSDSLASFFTLDTSAQHAILDFFFCCAGGTGASVMPINNTTAVATKTTLATVQQ